MLIRYKVENVFSFKNPIELNLNASRYQKHNSHISEIGQEYKVLKTSAIYGANAAGKSNILKSLNVIKELIVDGTTDRLETIDVFPFKLDDSSQKKPSNFEIEFFNNGSFYLYTLSVLDSVIKKEELYKLNRNGKSFEDVFKRESNETKTTFLKISAINERISKAKIRAEIYKEDLRPNQPFLFEGFNKNIPDVVNAFNWFKEKLLIIGCDSYPINFHKSISENSELKVDVLKLLKEVDSGIIDIIVYIKPVEEYIGLVDNATRNRIIRDIKQSGASAVRDVTRNIEYFFNDDSELVAAEMKIVRKKDGTSETVEFDLLDESDGTRRFIDIIPLLLISTIDGATVLVDELERSMHPILVVKMLDYFYLMQKKNTGQIIFTTHESTLMNLKYFRQDEIWFTEKKVDGATELYSLSEFKPRYDKDIQKSYFQGKFGAIPFLSRVDALEE